MPVKSGSNTPPPCWQSSASELFPGPAVFFMDCGFHRIAINFDTMKHVRLIAVWLLMLALPLQGLAAFAPSARCADDQPGNAAQATHGSSGGHHGVMLQTHDHPADDQQHDDGQPADQGSGHSCCHHVYSGASSATVPGTPAPPHAVMLRVLLLSTLHIPELPQRPPRA